MENSQLIIGVDAGGTKTKAWLARVPSWQRANSSEPSASSPLAEQVQVIGHGSAGAGNLRAIGFEAATDNIKRAIEAAYSSAKCERYPAAAVCMGVAGAGRVDEQKRLEQWCLNSQIARRAQVTGDALPVLAAAYAQRPLHELAQMSGIALICGTGSMAWGCCAREPGPGDEHSPGVKQARAGGWGYLLGDEGSGYWIALQGLRAACRSVDGRGPATHLLPALLHRLELTDPAQLIGVIYDPQFDRRRIASLAEVVVELAERPNPAADNPAADSPAADNPAADSQAVDILDRAAAELCQLVLAVDAQLGLGAEPVTLAATGGVLLGSSSLRQRLQQRLQQHPRAINFAPIEDPVQGAVYLAAGLAGGVTVSHR